MVKRILVVDDQAVLRELHAELLEDAGYRVTVAEDGEQAVEAIAREVPDLVLLDLHMPRLGGRGVLERLARLPAPPSVIVMTGSGKVDFSLPPFVRGTLEKPASATELEAAVQRALKE